MMEDVLVDLFLIIFKYFERICHVKFFNNGERENILGLGNLGGDYSS